MSAHGPAVLVIGFTDVERGRDDAWVPACGSALSALSLPTLSRFLTASGIARQKFPERLEIVRLRLPMNASRQESAS